MPITKQDIANNAFAPTPNEVAALSQILEGSKCAALAVDVAGRAYFRYGAAAPDGPRRTSQRTPRFARAAGAGTVSWFCAVGDAVVAGHEIGALTILDQLRPMTAGATGRVVALLVSEGDLVGHGAALAAIKPSDDLDAVPERTTECL